MNGASGITMSSRKYVRSPGVVSKIQSGRLVDIGNVRLVGMNRDDVANLFKLRFDDAGKQVYMWPDEIIQNTLLAFATSPTSASGYAGATPTGPATTPAATPAPGTTPAPASTPTPATPTPTAAATP